MLKGILIDPSTQRIEVVSLSTTSPNSLDSFREAIGCEWVESVYDFSNGDRLYVDDEGFKRIGKLAFKIEGSPIIYGKAIVIGIDDAGEREIDNKSSIDDIRGSIKFFNKIATEDFRKQRQIIDAGKSGLN
jgi:hypothetical protein